jgi:hypothetical protein
LLDICHRRGARLLTLSTEQPLDSALLELISHSSSLITDIAANVAARGATSRKGGVSK